MKPVQDQIVYAYMRVSQSDLHLENQRPALEGRIAMERFNQANVVWITEQESTGRRRPVKEKVMEDARIGKVDVLIFHRVDRWGRSIVELVSDIEELVKMNVRVIIPGNNIDLSNDQGGLNPFNRLVLQLFAMFAEFEKGIMQERTRDGIKRGRAWGRIPGRHPVNCGCGFVSENGKIRHDGPMKPIRDEHNRYTGEWWDESKKGPKPKREAAKPSNSNISEPAEPSKIIETQAEEGQKEPQQEQIV